MTDAKSEWAAPWVVGKDGIVRDSEGRVVALVGIESTEKLARLIAAAPELAEAVERLYPIAESELEGCECEACAYALEGARIGRAALEKAGVEP